MPARGWLGWPSFGRTLFQCRFEQCLPTLAVTVLDVSHHAHEQQIENYQRKDRWRRLHRLDHRARSLTRLMADARSHGCSCLFLAISS